MKTEETKLTFYGNQAFAMLPLVGYILIGGTFSVGLHYYSMKGLSFAAAVSLFAGFSFAGRRTDIGTAWSMVWPNMAIPG